MNNILNLFANGIVNYLLLGSVVAALLTLLAWGIIRVAKIRAPIYRHMIWLYLLMGIVVLPAIWLGGPKLTLAVLPAQVEPLKTEVLETDAGNAVKIVQNSPNETHSPSLTHTRMPVETNPGTRAFPSKSSVSWCVACGRRFYAGSTCGWLVSTSSNPPVNRTCITKRTHRKGGRTKIKDIGNFSCPRPGMFWGTEAGYPAPERNVRKKY